MTDPREALDAKLRAEWEAACERGEVCMECGRASDFVAGGIACCNRCAAAAYAEQMEDRAAASDDLLRHRRLRRAGTVPVAGENARPRKRAGGMFDTGD